MGHDISAYRNEYDSDGRETVYQETVGKAGGDEWRAAYDKYKDQVEVAYFRRNMSYYRGEVGALLYEVLGKKAMDCYAGVSGDGSERTFGIEELMLAKALVLKRGEGQTEVWCKVWLGDELKFLNACIEYASAAPERHVLIYFG